MLNYDAIVIGLGAMGGAALREIASRGRSVLGIEQFAIGHARGSSHGETRIIRRAYFEHPDYVPLVNRAYAGWQQLEAECGRAFFHRVGLLMAGAPTGALIQGVRRTAAAHGLDIHDVSAADFALRFAGFRLPPQMSALFERDAGYLDVDDAVRAQIESARRFGAEVRENDPVLEWRAGPAGVEVRTARGTLSAGRLVIGAGAWSARALAPLILPLSVRRKVQLWFATSAYRADAGSPVFCYDTPAGFYYGFPAIGAPEIKVARHDGGDTADPDNVDRALHAADEQPVARFVADALPLAEPRAARHSVCLYTMTPDENFVVDLHPRHANVALACGFSGHGFKFAPAIGAALADLALEGRTSQPTGFLGIRRLL
jgi:sarcosine oxidase